MVDFVAHFTGHSTTFHHVRHPTYLTHATIFALPAGPNARLLGHTDTGAVIVFAARTTHHQIANITETGTLATVDVVAHN
jgi:hypothetical protein